MPKLSAKTTNQNSIANNVLYNAVSITHQDQELNIVENKASYAWILSLRHFHIKYAFHEIKKIKGLSLLNKTMIKGIILLKWIISYLAKIDSTVYLNHDLNNSSVCNMYFKNKENIKTLLETLRLHYPSQAFVVRSLDEYLYSSEIEALLLVGFKKIASRKIYYFDPKNSFDGKKRYQIIRDLNITKKMNFELIEKKNLSEIEVIKVSELYQSLYIKKHSPLNPIYTKDYFNRLLSSSSGRIFLLNKDCEILGFFICHYHSDVIYLTCLGYDTSKPKEYGLYRQLFSHALKLSIAEKKIMHLSAGASNFKSHRGCHSVKEYNLVYYKHLNIFRRINWYLFARVVNELWLPFVSKFF
jgi:hypothetical protein